MSPRTGMDWLQDYMDCLLGDHGDWWRERADQLMEDEGSDLPTDGTSWKRWREIRRNENPPPAPSLTTTEGEPRP